MFIEAYRHKRVNVGDGEPAGQAAFERLLDLEKHYLYKANNRVKTAVISSLDEGNPFEFEYRFEDFVHFAEIDFPAKVSKVSFTIKDVYNGEKWNDTCVTAVITRRD